MAEGTFPDLAARDAHDVDASAMPMASSVASEADLIVANDDQGRPEVIEPGRALAIAFVDGYSTTALVQKIRQS